MTKLLLLFHEMGEALAMEMNVERYTFFCGVSVFMVLLVVKPIIFMMDVLEI